MISQLCLFISHSSEKVELKPQEKKVCKACNHKADFCSGRTSFIHPFLLGMVHGLISGSWGHQGPDPSPEIPTPTHTPGSQVNAPGLSAPAPVMLQEGSPAAHSPVLPSHRPILWPQPPPHGGQGHGAALSCPASGWGGGMGLGWYPQHSGTLNNSRSRDGTVQHCSRDAALRVWLQRLSSYCWLLIQAWSQV